MITQKQRMVLRNSVGILNAENSGISNNVFIGTLPRLAGANAIMTMSANELDTKSLYDLYKTVQAQKLSMNNIKPTVTTLGGGITPINQEYVQNIFGNDCIIGIGGAIQGHPMGTTVGAETAIYAVEATHKAIALADAASNHAGLAAIIDIWK